MIDIDKVPFLFIKKEPYIGSDSGMRYRLKKTTVDEKDYIEGAVWPEPYCYQKTDEALITKEMFEFSKDGTVSAVEWLNEQLKVRAELWDSVNNKPLLTIM